MNIVTGTILDVDEPVFEGGSFGRGRNSGARVIGRRQFVAEVTRESYGRQRGQHTFTLRVVESRGGVKAIEAGAIVRRKGRTLYPNSTIIDQPDNLDDRAADKHARAQFSAARNLR